MNEEKKKESKTRHMYGCSLQEKHTEFAFEDPDASQERRQRRFTPKDSPQTRTNTASLFPSLIYQQDLCFALFPALSGRLGLVCNPFTFRADPTGPFLLLTAYGGKMDFYLWVCVTNSYELHVKRGNIEVMINGVI